MILTGFTIKFKTKCEDYNVKIRNGNVLAVKKAIIALAGPMVNLIIILACLIFYKEIQETYLLGLPLELLIYSNILIFAFNISYFSSVIILINSFANSSSVLTKFLI